MSLKSGIRRSVGAVVLRCEVKSHLLVQYAVEVLSVPKDVSDQVPHPYATTYRSVF